MIADDFHDFKTIVFQNEKKTPRNFVPFIVCLLHSPFNYTPNMTLLLSRTVSKGIGVTKSNGFKEFVMILLALTWIFYKKSKLVFDFVIFDVLFVDLGHILDNFRSQRLP